MSADDPHDPTDDASDDPGDVEPADLRAELDRQRGQSGGLERGGEGLIDLLSAAFDTDRRTRVYVALRREPNATVETLAEETGLYPAAVERVLSDLREEGVVERREAPTPEYTAAAPMEAVDAVLGRIQGSIDDRFRLGRPRGREAAEQPSDPVTIPVEKADAETRSDDSDE